MPDITYTTKPEDMLDYICWKHYGSSSGFVEAVLEYEKNYRLADQPELLPGELTIYLPEVRVEQKEPIRLWDL